jgi:hypothetical protein
MNRPGLKLGSNLESELEAMEAMLAEASGGQTGQPLRIVLSAGASAAVVNRTHRIVRERAMSLQARRTKLRSMWIPLTVSGGLLAVIVCAIWTVLDEYELTPTGLPDANQQMLVLAMWCLPVSALLLAVVWMRREAHRADHGSAG